MIPLSRGLNHMLRDQVFDLKFLRLHLLVVCDPDMLSVGRDANLHLLSLFLRLIQRQEKLGIVLVLDHSFHSECWHADVDRDDRLCSVCQRERGFTSRDAFGCHVGPSTLGSFSIHLPLALSIFLH